MAVFDTWNRSASDTRSTSTVDATDDVEADSHDWIAGAAPTPAAIVSRSSATDPSCHAQGHVNHSRVYHGRSAHALAAASTRGSNVCGARGIGNSRNRRLTKRSSSKEFTLLPGHQPAERLPAAMNIRFDLAERHAQRVCDL